MTGYHRLIATLFCSIILVGTISSTSLAWQQSVNYRMSVTLDVKTHSYSGKQRLVYHNNSPDTITEVYYHLYYNAFKPGSMMDRRDHALPHHGWKGIDQLPQDEQGDVSIASLSQDGTALRWNVDETILQASLAHPLLPGDSTVLTMAWQSVIPRVKRRGGWMSAEGVEYSMSQWYPKLAEYDKNGWHADEYVEREFYGVFGTFDVEVTLPATYIVGGTGTIVNGTEVGCGYELTNRDTVIAFPASGEGNKTWKFHAENVHDFAWVADQDYAHEIVHWNDVPIHILYKRDLLLNRRFAGWKYAGVWTTNFIEYYSKRFGPYAWPSFTVAQAGDGGMEYPMLIMITGYRGMNSLYRVIAHEAGHQWYYGMMANNETQEAWLDEGLTQYLTDEADRALNGENTANPYTGLNRVVYPWDQSRWRDIYPSYDLAIKGYDEPLNTFHDHFREDATAALVYSRGEMVARQLQYMLGDSLFDAGMKRYYTNWRFRHPSARDFERSMEEGSGMRLDWFFNQWLGSTKKCDYAIDGLSSNEEGAGEWQTTLELSNRDEIIMPLDIRLTYEDGTTAMANIPVELWSKPGMEFNLPRWSWVDRTYRTTFSTPQKVIRAEIDPSGTLFDLDRTNNIASTGFLSGLLPSSHVAFYRRWDTRRPMDRYSIRIRPTLWYSKADGPAIGFLADGGYAFDRYNATFGVAWNATSERVDYTARYETPVGFLGRLGRVSLLGTNDGGIQNWHAELSKDIRPFFYQTNATHTVRLFADHSRLLGDNYPNRVAAWDSGDYNTIGFGYNLTTGAVWRNYFSLDLKFDASVVSRTTFAQWQLKGDWKQHWLGLDFRTNFFAGTSAGSPPAQRLFNATGASSTAMHANVVHRLFMNAEPAFAARNHLILPTEGSLVSLTEIADSMQFSNHLLNVKLEIGGLNPLKVLKFWPFNHIDLRPYGAAGWVFPDVVTFKSFEDYSAEIGVVASVDLLDMFLSQVLKDGLDSPSPVRLSFTAPLWATSPLLKKKGWQYRWGIGISM